MRTSLNFSKFFSTYLKGFAMGCADIVPGVSGGTMALILNIYKNLVSEVSKIDHELIIDILKLNFKEIKDRFDWGFLLPLGFGILSAIIIGAFVIHKLLAVYPEATWAFFLGLMIASCWVLKKRIERFHPHLVILFAFIAFGIIQIVPFKTPATYPLFLLAGAIGIIAMILPGVSGAFLLLVMGKYEQVTGALKAPFFENHLLIILLFALGCLIGLASFSKILKKALDEYPNATYSALLGFIIGSLPKLWPWKESLKTVMIRGKEVTLQTKNILPKIWASYDFLVILLLIIGIFLVIFIEKKSQRGISSAG